MSVLVNLASVLRHVENPLPLFLDRAGIRKRSYVLRTTTGVAIEIRPQESDRYTFYETLIMNEYLQQGQRLRRGDTVIDIGANIGCFSVLAARAVGPTGRVIAVEPEQSTFARLERNIDLNRCDNVKAKRLAVGGSSGTVELHVADKALFSSIYPSVNGTAAGSNIEQVEVTTVDALMDALDIERCNYLKVDCEGAEYDIFRRMGARTASRIDQITMEVHRVPGDEPEALSSRLGELGFSQDFASLLYAWR